MTRFKDYDVAAERDSDKREDFEFVLGGDSYTALPEQEARTMLDFLRKTASENSADIADGIKTILGKEIWNRIYRPLPGASSVKWGAVRALCNDLAIYYGGGIVGSPKAVMGDQPTMEPVITAEISPDGSVDTSGSLPDGETLSDSEPPPTDST